MKKNKTFFIYALLLIIAACNNQSNNQSPSKKAFTINGKINGVHAGSAKLVSRNEADGTSKTLDSVEFKNDTFQLKGQLAAPQMMTLIIQPGNLSLPVFVENNAIQIIADTSGAEYYDMTANGESKGANFKTYSISGSKSNDDYTLYKNDTGLKKYGTIIIALSEKIDSLYTIKKIDDAYRVKEQADSAIKELDNKKLEYAKNYALKNPGSPVGAYILSQVYNYMIEKPVAKTDSILQIFKGDAKASDYYKSVAETQAKIKALRPGNTAPDFTLYKKDSSKFTLSSARGKYIMVDFWASWCHPCRQAIPHWKKIYAQYHPKGFDMVSVSADAKRTDWIKAMDIEKMPWQQVCDEFPKENMPSTVGGLYMLNYIPFYVLLDKEGKILVYSGKEEDIDNKLKEIYGS